MGNQDKGNKNIKKVATKAPKAPGSAKVPKYEQSETGITAPLQAPKTRKS